MQARIERIDHRLDVRTLRPEPEPAHELGVKQIGRVLVRLQQGLPLLPDELSRVGGALVVVDPTSRTSGALLVEAASVGQG